MSEPIWHYFIKICFTAHERYGEICMLVYEFAIKASKTSSSVRSYFPAFLSSADFFQNQLFLKILSGISSECQIVLIQIIKTSKTSSFVRSYLASWEICSRFLSSADSFQNQLF